jgi:uncharacterized protein YjbI with pentapeptide repeats
MANADHLKRLRQGVDAWNAWRTKMPLRPDLSEANLSGADLGGVDLSGADLGRGDLSEADLRKAILFGAKLGGADLSGADLREADLRETILLGAKLVGAELGGAKLDQADLRETDFVDADLREADLGGSDLRKADFDGAVLGGVRLRGADLRGAKLGGAKLGGVDLGGVDLSEANLGGAVLGGVSLRGADLGGASLRGADLRGADLGGADLGGADFGEADLRETDLHETDLFGVKLGGAKLGGTNLRGASLGGADLRGSDLGGADFREANLVDTCLDHADLTGAKLWETQRAGWSIKDVICRIAFWDREGKEPTEYEEGEFERIFAEKPRIVLRYPGGMSAVDLLALPLIVERLQAEHPQSVLQVRSVQNDAGGASVTITVEDLASRSTEAFGKELIWLRTKLECVVEERDHLRQRMGAMFSEGISKMAEFLALPRQEVHVHHPSGPTAIEGPTMSRDTYNIHGQAGAAGPGARAERNTFQQIQGGIDLPKLAEELGRLRDAMKGESTGAREQDKAIGAVADAEEAAAKGDGPAALRYLKSAGEWTLGIAEKIGVAVATEALKKAM